MATGFAVAGRKAGKDGPDSNRDYLQVNTEGTKVYFDETTASGKAVPTGFAVAGRKAGKSGATTDDYLTIKPDGTTVYINENEIPDGSKAVPTGFAVAGRKAGKDGNADILKVTKDSTRVYVDGSSSNLISDHLFHGNTLSCKS